ncbi:unnamed protein product [Rodentolepis nana]|uniref:LisH domain-containing protein n=1 Tax=Rodentolepis nana TaxID=102285 RepID=A0A0R3TZ67_RODNA|nr:unnamed protein product [Rodentolepis nana]
MNVVTMPCVMLISPTTALIANFGQRDFTFAIAQHIAQERCTAVTQAIEDKLTADLASVEMQRFKQHDSFESDSTLPMLAVDAMEEEKEASSIVFDYLMRNGYLATANAMARPSIVPRNAANNNNKAAVNGTDSSNALDTNKLPHPDSSNAKPTSLNLKPLDMSNGICDQDASVANTPPNTKSSPTQPTASQADLTNERLTSTTDFTIEF